MCSEDFPNNSRPVASYYRQGLWISSQPEPPSLTHNTRTSMLNLITSHPLQRLQLPENSLCQRRTRLEIEPVTLETIKLHVDKLVRGMQLRFIIMRDGCECPCPGVCVVFRLCAREYRCCMQSSKSNSVKENNMMTLDQNNSHRSKVDHSYVFIQPQEILETEINYHNAGPLHKKYSVCDPHDHHVAAVATTSLNFACYSVAISLLL